MSESTDNNDSWQELPQTPRGYRPLDPSSDQDHLFTWLSRIAFKDAEAHRSAHDGFDGDEGAE